jgi:hypothetical protein
MSAVPFKANADRRHHIPKQQDRVTNWSEYEQIFYRLCGMTQSSRVRVPAAA